MPFYTSLFWHGVRAGTHETLALAQRGVRLRIHQDSKARLRDTRRSRSQFPTPQSLLRLANRFRTRPRCDANRANAPLPRAKASWESKKGSVWSRREPTDCHSRRPGRVWHLEKTKPERCAAKDRQYTEPSRWRTYSCMPSLASACWQANTTIRSTPARDRTSSFCLAKALEARCMTLNNECC